MNRIKRRKYIMSLIALFILGVVFFYYGFKECDEVKYSYIENNSVDYKVYLKNNKFFDKPYLEKNQTYITSLINYIDANYCYNVKFNQKVSGTINHQIVAEIKADKKNNEVGNYWTKEFDLTTIENENVNSVDSHVINLEQKIDYNKYNDLMNNFINTYNLQTEASLRVYLKVTGDVNVDDTNEKMNIDSKVSLNIPLSKQAIEGKIETDNNNNQSEITSKANENEPFRKTSKVLAVIVSIMFISNLIKYMHFLVNRNKHLNYRDTIKKINRDYEDLIIKVKKVDTKNLSIVDLDSFDDLINIYNSVRTPINFQYENDKSKFFIIDGNTCYMYTIVNEGLINEKIK